MKPIVILFMLVVPYIGTWIETATENTNETTGRVVPYIGTWIETIGKIESFMGGVVVPYIGTWIETCCYGRFIKRRRSYLI